jgi:hypothetical protein
MSQVYPSINHASKTKACTRGVAGAGFVLAGLLGEGIGKRFHISFHYANPIIENGLQESMW